MATTDPRIDAYIGRSAAFATPILTLLRGAVHEACPGAEETIKWGMPFFVMDGRILAHMAAFKQHCAFGFWRGRGAPDQGKNDEAMGQFGRIESISDLPARRELIRLIKASAREAVAAVPTQLPAKAKAKPKPALPVPEALAAALRGNPAAQEAFDAFSNSHRREYIAWIVEAKREETRARRVAEAVAQLAEGKARHWKYQNC